MVHVPSRLAAADCGGPGVMQEQVPEATAADDEDSKQPEGQCRGDG